MGGGSTMGIGVKLEWGGGDWFEPVLTHAFPPLLLQFF